MLDTSIQVRTEHFDGPLALLLFLIKKEEVSIENVDMTKVTEQYLDYLSGMQKLNFDIAGDYLYLATTLLFLKSKTAVSSTNPPNAQEDADTEGPLVIQTHDELIRRLMTLARFQKMGAALWSLPRLNEDVFQKPKVNKKNVLRSLLIPMDLEKMLVSMIGVLEKEKRKHTVINTQGPSIEDKLVFLKDKLTKGAVVDFDDLLDKDGEGRKIDDIIVTFISLLELARMGKVLPTQETYQDPIHIHVLEPVEHIDFLDSDGLQLKEKVEEKIIQ